MKAAVVVDLGTANIRAGVAGSEKPAVVFNNVVGRPKFHRVMDGGRLPDIAVGGLVDAHRGALSLQHPLERGLVLGDRWNDVERVLAAAYGAEQGLGVDPRAQPLVLTESVLAPRAHRERTAEVVFEGLGAPAVHFAIPAALSLYAAGQTTGLVVDSGEGVTSIVPIYEGHVCTPAVQRLELAGRDVTEALRLHLRRSSFLVSQRGASSTLSYGGALGPTLHSSSELELVRELKERACFVAKDPKAESAGAGQPAEYRLPDGQAVVLGHGRHRASEVLFDPRQMGHEGMSVHHAVAAAVGGCEVDLREAMLASVHLAGGTTCTPGFGQRLLWEVRKLAPEGSRVRITAPASRKHSAWTGGSIFASLGTFRAALVTKELWEEAGAAALWKDR